jgi:preprotein translocase subunit SecA
LVGLKTQFEGVFLNSDDLSYTARDFDSLDSESLEQQLLEKAMSKYNQKLERLGTEKMSELERFVLLQTVDAKWMDHIDMMDHLRQTVGLRAYAQKDPVIEYKIEGFELFEQMVESIRNDTVKYVFLAEFRSNPPKQEQNINSTATTQGKAGEAQNKSQPVKSQNKVGRNDPCPCGSGKKYKKCCGA